MLNLSKTVGEEIRKLRKKQNLTQEDLAEKTDIDYRSIGSIERGERNITLQTLEKIAKALGVTPQIILSTSKDDEREILIQELLDIFKDKDIKHIKYGIDILKMFFKYSQW